MQTADRDTLRAKPNTSPATRKDAARAPKNIMGKRAQASVKFDDFGLIFFAICEQCRQNIAFPKKHYGQTRTDICQT